MIYSSGSNTIFDAMSPNFDPNSKGYIDVLFFFFFFCLFAISLAAPAAYGGSQARGPIGALASGLCQSHSKAGSKPRLQPTPQLSATPDP